MLKLVTRAEHWRNTGGDLRSADKPSSLSKKLGKDILHQCHISESPLSNSEALRKCGFVVVACNLTTGPTFQPVPLHADDLPVCAPIIIPFLVLWFIAVDHPASRKLALAIRQLSRRCYHNSQMYWLNPAVR
ncbi:hypothetical protein HAX54_044465 [Datura stramonium]|uniref:Uncharacterized protein n=1 Tax=Datura stramonium TaxID=4076 RepID=A0ABS8SPI3_DATST|nr:hypothetical protein [Datura stramonium]